MFFQKSWYIYEQVKKFKKSLILNSLYIKHIELMKKTNPRQVMIYPIDRETPAKNLVKLNSKEMKRIYNIIKDAGYNVLAVGI